MARRIPSATRKPPKPSREALLVALAERDRELAEARQRDAEARERQTATAEILRVLSESPTDPQPVFESVVLTAARLLHCTRAFVLLCDGDAFSVAASASPEGVLTPRAGRTPIDPNANFPSRAIVAKQKLHVPDYSLVELTEHERNVRDRYGANCSLFLPLLRQGECFGLLTLIHQRANAFGPEEIALAESFRDQALIAIENVRLFDEVQARTRDLTEALQQQTATSEVLKVISRSAFDLQLVLDTLVQSAAKLCDADQACVFQRDGDLYRWVSNFGFSSELVAYAEAHPFAAGSGSTTSRVALEGSDHS